MYETTGIPTVSLLPRLSRGHGERVREDCPARGSYHNISGRICVEMIIRSGRQTAARVSWVNRLVRAMLNVTISSAAGGRGHDVGADPSITSGGASSVGVAHGPGGPSRGRSSGGGPCPRPADGLASPGWPAGIRP